MDAPKSQLMGIGVSVVIALIAGVVVGTIIALLGRHEACYNDAAEFELD